MKRLAGLTLLLGCTATRAPEGADAGPELRADARAARADLAPADRARDALAEDPEPAALAPPAVLAERLARLIWGSAADDSTVTKAGAARTRADIEALAREMLKDARARNGVAAFVRGWLDLDRLAELPKKDQAATKELRASLQAEAPALGVAVVFDSDGRLETLLTAPYTFVDATLARHYGLTPPAAPGSKIAYPESGERVGIFGTAGVLARFGSDTEPPWPPRRYGMLSWPLLCEEDGLYFEAPTAANQSNIDPKKPIKAQLIETTDREGCRGCHIDGPINRIGFAFMKFDVLGRFRESDVGGPIDTSATIELGDGSTLAYDNQPELMRQIATMPSVRKCFARRYFEHAGLEPDRMGGAADRALRVVQDAFEASGGDVRELVVAIARSSRFISP